MSLRTISVLIAMLALMSSWSPPTQAQEIFGSIQGTITDDSGGIVPAVHVTVTNLDTGIMQSSQTNAAGIYFVGEIRPGRYKLKAEAPGFTQSIQSEFTVRVQDHVRLDIKLHVGQVSEQVEVKGEAPLLQSEEMTLGKVVEEQSIKHLPLNGRNAFDLVTLVPGVQSRSGDAQPRISGGRDRTGEFVVDGSSITLPRRGDLLTQPNLDAIQEFKVETSGLSAEFGRTVGGVVNATLKSGTNQYHGDLFEFLRNADLNARNFYANTIPKQVQNQFGGMVGGPIRKDRTFFFVAYEGFRLRGESNFNIVVPTAAMKNGDYSGLLGAKAGTDALGNSVLANEVYDPLSTQTSNGKLVREPFAGNIIPASRFDPAGKRVLDLYPDPNLPGLAANFRVLKPSGNSNNRVDSRVDQRFSDRDLFFAHFSLDNQRGQTARPFTYSLTGGHSGDFNRFKTGSATWTRTITPTTINDVRFSALRGYEGRQFAQEATPAALGIPNLGDIGIPRFDLAGYTGIGDSVVRSPAQEQFQIQDIATFVRGRHIFKAGVDIRRFIINDLQLLTNGQYGFSTLETGDPFSSRGGNVVASMLLGQVDSFTNDPNRGRFYHRSTYAGTFLQDDFKVSPILTLNIGIRYDVEQEPNETRWNGSNFNLTTGQVETMRQLGRNRIQLTDKNNFSPRVGFAWTPFTRTVIRSHYGIFYTPLSGRATSAFDQFPQDQIYQLQSNGLNPAIILSRTPFVVPSPLGLGLSHSYRDAHAPVGYFQQWNFDIQHQAPLGIVTQASYSASVAKHLPMGVNYNQIPIGVVQAAGRGTQAMRPYAAYATIDGQDERGSSNYQALQLSAEKRFASGLSFLFAYTFSKLLDDTEDVFGATPNEDSYNLRLEKGLSWANHPHRFTGSGIYELPFGTGKSLLGAGAMSHVAGNWRLGWIVTLQSGNEVTITDPTNTAQDFSSGFRPNRTGNPVLPADARTLTHWFNTEAFQAPAPLTIGNSPSFPNIEGPGLANFDLSLSRVFRLPLNDQSHLDLRGECFNCFNRVNFSEPNGQFGTTSFGRISSALSARLLQVALKFWF